MQNLISPQRSTFLNQSELNKFTVYVKFSLTTRVRRYFSVIHLSFPSDFPDNLWLG